MSLGQRRQLVALDNPNGNNGYISLDPPSWYCQVLANTSGEATLVGHYHPGITTATRVHLGTRIYHVKAISNREERNEELTLDCTEVFD